jgi:hypothetical protein
MRTGAVFDRGHCRKVTRTKRDNDNALLNAVLAKAFRLKQLRELSKGAATTANDRGNGITMKLNIGGDNAVVHVFDMIKQEEEALGFILSIGSSKRRRHWLLPPY